MIQANNIYLSALMMGLFLTFCVFAATAQTEAPRNNGAVLSVRAAQKNRSTEDNIGDAQWLREVYRFVDLSKDENAALYYPVTPQNGRLNLFALLFKLLAENKIHAYEYMDGKEVFEDAYQIDFKELLDRFGIYYEMKEGEISVADADIPSNEAQGYFVKEAYFFDGATANFGHKVMALCPVLQRQDDFGSEQVRYPLFWVAYDDIRPYTQRMPVMLSNMNNVQRGSLDDFFTLHNYNGEIFKTTSMHNKTLSHYASNTDELKEVQNKVEQQIADFERNLWKNKSDSLNFQNASSGGKIKTKARPRTVKSNSQSSVNTMRDRRY